eukprot:scaffold2162_cov113-Cylindrotheca_fusiformis.AAC.2
MDPLIEPVNRALRATFKEWMDWRVDREYAGLSSVVVTLTCHYLVLELELVWVEVSLFVFLFVANGNRGCKHQ